MKMNSAGRADRTARRAAMVNLTLTDLLMIIVFVLLFYTFRATEESRVEISVREARLTEVIAERDKLRRDLATAQETIQSLNEKVADLETTVQRLLAGATKLPANPTAVISGQQRDIERLTAENSRLRAENARLLARVAELEKLIPTAKPPTKRPGNGGNGYQRCPITAGFLLNIKLVDSGGFVVVPAWEADADQSVRAIEGISEMTTGREISAQQFSHLANKISDWGLDQEPKCRFHVRTFAQTNSLSVYRRQMALIDQYFYPTR